MVVIADCKFGKRTLPVQIITLHKKEPRYPQTMTVRATGKVAPFEAGTTAHEVLWSNEGKVWADRVSNICVADDKPIAKYIRQPGDGWEYGVTW